MKAKVLNTGVILAVLLVLMPAAFVAADDPIDVCTIQNFTFEFEADASGNALQAGQIIDDEWAAWGIHVTSMNQASYPAMIFDSSNPTGGDSDLGSPNQAYGGPGVGAGGAPDGGGPNSFAQRKILIISEDGDQNDPDDKGNGGTLTFTFDSAQYIREVHVLDIDEGTGNGGTIKAFDAVSGGNQIGSTAPMVRLGDNSFQVVSVQADGVRRLEIYFKGSGGVPAIGFCEQNPTAVELASFGAAAQGNAITLNWETASELDNLGFNVYRAEAADGPRSQLNASLIASQNPGSPLGASYEFVDASAAPGLTYYYWLEAVDLNGAATLHGPVSAALAPLSRLLPARPRLVAGPPRLGSR